MALIYCKEGDWKFYVSDPYWCADSWFIKADDDELVIGVRYIRQDITDKKLGMLMRSTLRSLSIKGKIGKEVTRSQSVFKTTIGYKYTKAGICNLTLNGPITSSLLKYLDHGQVIKGEGDLRNQIIWNQ